MERIVAISMKIKASASSFPGQILWEKFAKVSENLCGRLTHTPDQSEDEIVRIKFGLVSKESIWFKGVWVVVIGCVVSE